MGTRNQGQRAAVLVSTRERFERWRRRRKVGARIPEGLWAAAVRVARAHGASATANVLGLDYYALKRRLGQPPAADASSRPQFIELRAVAASHVTECILELEDASGTKLRVQLKGMTAADVATVSRSLWSEQP